jgi:hypothetical protein
MEKRLTKAGIWIWIDYALSDVTYLIIGTSQQEMTVN